MAGSLRHGAMVSRDMVASALDSPLVIPFEQDRADPPIDSVFAEQDADELRGASLTSPLTRSSGFAEGSFGAVLQRERDAGQDAGLSGCVVPEYRVSILSPDHSGTTDPIGDAERGKQLGDARAAGASRTPVSRAFPPLRPPGLSPARPPATRQRWLSGRTTCFRCSATGNTRHRE